MALATIYILELTRLGLSEETLSKVLDIIERVTSPSRDRLEASRIASRDRQRKCRENKKLVSENVTVASRDTLARASFFLSSSTEDSLTNQGKKESKKVVTPAREQEPCQDDWPADYGDQFWQAYPRKTEKLSAMKKLATIRKQRVVSFAELMSGVKRYAATLRDPKYTKHPTTWLNAGCWTDETQQGIPNGERTNNPRTTGHDAILAAFAREAGKITGNSPMAGAADTAQFSFGDGTDIRRPPNGHGTNGGTGAAHNGGTSGPNRVLEGEVIPPDAASHGFSSRGQHF